MEFGVSYITCTPDKISTENRSSVHSDCHPVSGFQRSEGGGLEMGRGILCVEFSTVKTDGPVSHNHALKKNLLGRPHLDGHRFH
jgi:hypothetical protein